MQKSMATVARRKVRREAARAGKERSVVPCSSVSGTKEALKPIASERAPKKKRPAAKPAPRPKKKAKPPAHRTTTPRPATRSWRGACRWACPPPASPGRRLQHQGR